MVLGFEARDIRMLVGFVRMGLRDRYLGSTLGTLWAVINPLLMLSIYTFVFGLVFRARIPGADTTLAYAIWLIAGYGPWLAISEGLSAATTSVTGNSSLVRNLPIKTELLPMAAIIIGMVPLLVTLPFLLVLLAIDGGFPTPAPFFLPLVLVIQIGFIVALGLFLAGLNVFLRDVQQVLPNALTVVLFLSPIFYSVEGLPRTLRLIAEVNPFFLIADGYRACLLRGEAPGLWGLGFLSVLTLALLAGGLGFFRRLQPHFDARL